MLYTILTGCFILTKVDAKDSANPISIEAIRLSPQVYDGKKLRVSGQVRSLNPARGRMDSDFMVLVLESSKTRSDDFSQILNVFSYSTPRLKKGSRVIVSGIYHETGYWAGSPHDHFIEATEITPIELN